MTPRDFGRIAAQAARQAINQRIRQIEKDMIYEEFKDRAGEIVSGTVRRFEKSDVILDLGKIRGNDALSRERSLPRNTASATACGPMWSPWTMPPAVRRSFSREAIQISSAACLKSRLAKSLTGPSN